MAAVPEELGELRGASVGIGPVNAALGAARHLALERPRAVLLIGTAGAYPGGPPIGALVVVRRLGMSDGIAELGLGYVPVPAVVYSTDATLRARTGLVEADVLTVEAITTDASLAASRGRSWQVEHMEAWSVAAAASAAGVPFVAVLGITNVVGPDAHAEWRANRGRVEADLRDVARKLQEGS